LRRVEEFLVSIKNFISFHKFSLQENNSCQITPSSQEVNEKTNLPSIPSIPSICFRKEYIPTRILFYLSYLCLCSACARTYFFSFSFSFSFLNPFFSKKCAFNETKAKKQKQRKNFTKSHLRIEKKRSNARCARLKFHQILSRKSTKEKKTSYEGIGRAMASYGTCAMGLVLKKRQRKSFFSFSEKEIRKEKKVSMKPKNLKTYR
jgi:hypothetical protein